MKKFKIKIEGMHCTSCALNVERSLKKISGVKDVKVNLLFKKATGEADEKVTQEQLKKAIKDVGYSPVEIEF